MYSFEIFRENLECVVFFSGQIEGDEGYYGDEFDQYLKSRNKKYDRVYFICPEYIETDLTTLISPESRFVSNIERGASKENVEYLVFDGFGDLKYFKFMNTDSSELLVTKEDIVVGGLHYLVRQRVDQVILRAPPGTIFEKPSGEKYQEFIKASELAVGFSECQFVAFCLLSKRPRRMIKDIWIDSSSMSLFVDPLVYFIKKFARQKDKDIRYHSFQSYGDGQTQGYRQSKPDNLDQVWVIISASRSNNLGRDLFREWEGLQHCQIVTLLSYADSLYNENEKLSANDEVAGVSDPGDRIVANISEFSQLHSLEETFGSEVPVKIIGENFTAQIEDPNQVLLKKVHGPDEISSFIHYFRSNPVLVLNRSKRNRKRHLYFDFQKFHVSEDEIKKKYLDWLSDIVSWYVPPSVRYIICDESDPESVLLAKDIGDIIGSKKVRRLDYTKISGIENNAAIIAVSPVISKGHIFAKLNSDLRLIGHDAQRIFVAPFATPFSKRDWSLLQSSLGMGPRGLKYGFYNFKRVYVGHQDVTNSWGREAALIEKFSSGEWSDRQRVLSKQSEGILDEVGVGGDPRLDFNVDFAFWAPGYQPEDVNPASVYWTVAAILQNLREKPFTLFDRDSLYKHVYQHSVLDPLNFSRFNDPLLQSCLWRSAHDGELDYRSCVDLSKKFTDILERLSEGVLKGECNALLDMLLGLGIGKIKLEKTVLEASILRLFEKMNHLPAYEEVLMRIASAYRIEGIEVKEKDDLPF
ncbi:Uncharacterised protein [BD1-7 clade bacterium]|uniref:Uncharacterized protein n=1 Tax=BD1-7 clade bacterium TaxID=2029982 RepID=A0A5S9P522_9GAMM|nr:Uncharacterised protein [BD1-7 clade bacterium]CAA0098595.1 Uncharacterised protein [BD1-7 clade bacterium]